MQLRPYAPADLPGLYRVCLATGEVGGDASALYRDPDLLGHLYAGAYPTADPGLSFVVRDDDGPVAGYIVATADSAAFADWQDAHWWPALRERYPLRAADDDSADARAIQVIHQGQEPVREVLDQYPAHMHIDLLAHTQGQGLGRRLIETLTAALRERGVRGLHLNVDERNTRAIAFYHRVGFRTLLTHSWGRTLGMDLTG